MINEVDLTRLGVACPMCGGTRLEETQDAIEPHRFLMNERTWLCLDCRDRERIAALNTDCAREGRRPETCDGCEHHRLGPRYLLDVGVGPTVYGPIRLTTTREETHNLCTLFRRNLGAATDKPKPLTRMCFTWED